MKLGMEIRSYSVFFFLIFCNTSVAMHICSGQAHLRGVCNQIWTDLNFQIYANLAFWYLTANEIQLSYFVLFTPPLANL